MSQGQETGRTSSGSGKFKHIIVISSSSSFGVRRMLLGNGSAYAETGKMSKELTEVL